MKNRSHVLKQMRNPGKYYFNRSYDSNQRAIEGTKNHQLLISENLCIERGKKHKKHF